MNQQISQAKVGILTVVATVFLVACQHKEPAAPNNDTAPVAAVEAPPLPATPPPPPPPPPLPYGVEAGEHYTDITGTIVRFERIPADLHNSARVRFIWADGRETQIYGDFVTLQTGDMTLRLIYNSNNIVVRLAYLPTPTPTPPK